MIKIFRSFGGYFEIPRVEKGCWINVANPSDLEITRLKEELFVPEDILLDILDADERPRLEYDDEWWLVIMRIPIPTANNGIPGRATFAFPGAISPGKRYPQFHSEAFSTFGKCLFALPETIKSTN
jgi:Mg2+ and Co2+ transporter CorA